MITTIAAGSILYLLARCPPALEPYVGRLLGHLPARLARPLLITLFKTLFSIGLVHKISSTLSSVALNNWRWTSDRERWDWPNEIAVVTGGCSGIGEEIVRSLARNGIKVVVLDIQDQPERLKKGKLRTQLSQAGRGLISRSCATRQQTSRCTFAATSPTPNPSSLRPPRSRNNSAPPPRSSSTMPGSVTTFPCSIRPCNV